MAGRRAAEAYRAFVGPLQQAASCVTEAVLLGTGRRPEDGPYSLTLPGGDPVALNDPLGLSFSLAIKYDIVEAEGDRGSRKARTAEYVYRLLDADAKTVFAYHWHPLSAGRVTWPHLHVYGQTGRLDLRRKHFPTNRISLESVLRLLISEFDVRPRRDDWQEVLGRTEAAFNRYRTW